MVDQARVGLHQPAELLDWAPGLKIPFEELGIKEAPVGETWGWNFNRHIMTGAGIWTGWSLTGASFHTPDKFGVIIFGIDKAAVELSGKLAATWGAVKGTRR